MSSIQLVQHAIQQDGLLDTEIQIRVEAVALHFKDVMLAMDMLPGFDPVMGMEGAGVVEQVGADVVDIKVGDEVVAISLGRTSGDGDGW